MSKPIISVITVVYNGAATLEQTIASVKAQTYSAIEYIVVDGGSKDNTVAIIESHTDIVSHWISEKDKGLYDAMNKGMAMATGEYVFFLNADDAFFAPDVLEKMMQAGGNADVIYGDVMVMDGEGKDIGLRSEVTPHQLPAVLTWKSLQYGMVVSHQAFLVKRAVAATYDLQYKIASDIDWMITTLKQAATTVNAGVIVAKFRTGGTSKERQQQAWKERYAILSKHYGAVANFIRHLFIAIRYIIKKPFSKPI
ncbi:Glycosyl transferase family 2 [Filimonas lacunae]|uniref:Glycosyl transferase family 2 n=1 Tax=Filimonas lacunae TaxID=477680 RepID=A0A173MIF4_9BACT|nr:glycosyltransferase family 2 protein [Filimonas lacunae]BAV07188.1 glycosyl transferase, family 2 [Filimonas lacunae]SIS93566.1 Glycosyl transferase family 2 [Filimonas lacunae]